MWEGPIMTRLGGSTGGARPGAPVESPDAEVGLGPGLRRAWVGYQQQLDAELAAAGFDDRRFPDGRVLRMCTRSNDTTTSQIGRELGITRQGANKIVAQLVECGYVTLTSSPKDRREKIVLPTPRALDYLAAHRTAARKIDRRLRDQMGNDAFSALRQLLETLGQDADLRLRVYLRRTTRF
jgi:DNA-binding MarR family transcriptional regulator